MRKPSKIILLLLLSFLIASPVFAQSLDSSNYSILDATVDSGGGQMTSTNYAGVISVGNPTADTRMTSGSYALGSGFPNGIQANVPELICFETDTDSNSTLCQSFPNANGAQGECGYPGCYDRAKLEIDPSANPVDTLYLIRIEDLETNTIYYLQSDHTLDTTYEIADFFTKCSLEGFDANDPDCDEDTDPNWDETLQRYNVFGLEPDREYSVSVSALSGDYTGSAFSEPLNSTTESPSILFDLDVSETDSNSDSPYELDLGELIYVAVTTAPGRIWVDLNTNAVNGANIYIRSANGALVSNQTGETIPSETEDLALDSNANGGYGIKVDSVTQTELGPLLANSLYDTTGAQEVGVLSINNTLLFYTESLNNNSGPILQGRGGVAVKARSSITDIASGDLNDQLTFICIGNY
ncbi:hypothetical protein H3C67_00045 [Candidatus Dojkabacteria bacterium]|uniref:Fibronectin type-III domain-containing protein n=1 Tax=Candidatus Dojkabacteria bacterium TaxID=2099670 RepID=A0A952AH70_9BACT|nr:hypothetical protein [Candidatus Dojkabacteria bacterium]